jgi:hypothetical protein
LLAVCAGVFFGVFRRQRNSFCMIALRAEKLFPWLRRDETGAVRFVDVAR